MSRKPSPSFDFTPEEREEVLCIAGEIETNPGKRLARAAELVLLRKFWDYVARYPYLFPERLQQARRALGKRSHLELLVENERAAIDG